jgi:putative FmdB family regulatory protein
MPTYLYECQSCEKTFEVEQRITEPALTSCACGSEGTVKRLVQPAAVLFRGAGFHVNDYAPSKPSETPTEPVCTGEPNSCGRCAAED